MAEYLFTIHSRKIQLNGKDFILRPFGDIHLDSEHCNVDMFNATMRQWEKEHTPNTYYIGMGDYLDFLSSSEQTAMNSIKEKLHQSSIKSFEKEQLKNIDWFCSKIKFMGENLLGLIEGNHNYTFSDGRNALNLICEKLNTKNLGWLTYYKLALYKHINKGTMLTYDIVAAHGKAGGKLVGASVNQVNDLRVVFPEADCYIMGHDHNKSATPVTILTVINHNGFLVVKEKCQYLCRSGSFLKAYIANQKSYAVKPLYRPCSLGWIEITVALRVRRGNKKFNDKTKMLVSGTVH